MSAQHMHIPWQVSPLRSLLLGQCGGGEVDGRMQLSLGVEPDAQLFHKAHVRKHCSNPRPHSQSLRTRRILLWKFAVPIEQIQMRQGDVRSMTHTLQSLIAAGFIVSIEPPHVCRRRVAHVLHAIRLAQRLDDESAESCTTRGLHVCLEKAGWPRGVGAEGFGSLAGVECGAFGPVATGVQGVAADWIALTQR